MVWGLSIPASPVVAAPGAVAAVPPTQASAPVRTARPGPSSKLAPAARRQALLRAGAAVVGVEVRALADAPTNRMMGGLRNGSGVVIGEDGLVLTIGHLLLEAEEVDLRLDSGRSVPARVVAVDPVTGFGLVKALLPLEVAPVPLARDTAVTRKEKLLLVSGGAHRALSAANLSARRPYSGYWEYHLENALFTRPLRTDHAGAGLFNDRGELLGIGSLLVIESPAEYERGPGNLFVPVDLLKPVYDELLRQGRTTASRRAWLGVNCTQGSHGVDIAFVSGDSPAEVAGLQQGDAIRRIDGVAVDDLASFYKQLWSGGDAERDVTLTVLREGEALDITLRSRDRLESLRRVNGI
jgi:serine protease Do